MISTLLFMHSVVFFFFHSVALFFSLALSVSLSLYLKPHSLQTSKNKLISNNGNKQIEHFYLIQLCEWIKFHIKHVIVIVIIIIIVCVYLFVILTSLVSGSIIAAHIAFVSFYKVAINLEILSSF